MRDAALSVLLLGLAFGGCAQLDGVTHNVGRSYQAVDTFLSDFKQRSAERQRLFDEQQAYIERRAATGQISWFQAARELRNLDRRSNPAYDRADEEYHTYSAAVAEQVDAGRITVAKFDALRSQRLTDLQRRRGKN